MGLLEDARNFQGQVVSVDAETRAAMETYYRGTLKNITRELDRTVKSLKKKRGRGKRVTKAWLQKQAEYKNAFILAEIQIQDFLDYAEKKINLSSLRAENIAIKQLLTYGPEALGKKPKKTQKRNFAPSLKKSGRIKSTELAREIAEQINSGKSRPQIVKELRAKFTNPLLKASVYARTETLNHFRNTLVDNLQGPEVIGWRWVARLDRRTCVVCIAMHGQVIDRREDFATHPNCRCTLVPVFSSESRIRNTFGKMGKEWFDDLTERDKRSIVGSRNLGLLKSGEITLENFIGEGESKKWGKIRYRKSPTK